MWSVSSSQGGNASARSGMGEWNCSALEGKQITWKFHSFAFIAIEWNKRRRCWWPLASNFNGSANGEKKPAHLDSCYLLTRLIPFVTNLYWNISKFCAISIANDLCRLKWVKLSLIMMASVLQHFWRVISGMAENSSPHNWLITTAEE